MRIRYRINDNGSFDICGKYTSLQKCFPMVDEVQLMPDRVITDESSITYFINGKKVVVSFRSENDQYDVDNNCNGRLGINCELSGFSGLHDVEPLGCPEIIGADHLFAQGFGMEGPSGTFAVEQEPHISHGITALYTGENILTLYTEDHTRYSTVFRVQKQKKLFTENNTICCGINLEGTAGGKTELPEIFLEEGVSLSESLKRAAEHIADRMHARSDKPSCMFWCSWYHAYETLDIEKLKEYLTGINENDDNSFQYIELDAGYAPSLGDWLLHNHRYPGGLKEAAELIIKAGYKPGIWIGPFMVGDNSELFRNHPDWMLKELDGKPLVKLRSYTEPKLWGNPDSNYFVLDLSHPDALAYIKKVFETFREWGFSFFKTDFMLWNMYDTSKVSRYDSSLTSVEIMRRTLDVIRTAIGDDSYLLGCIAPFMPFIGYADGMRIAGDGGAQWAEPFGPVNLLNELPCDNYFNNIFWQNDTDSILLRDFDTYLTDMEAESLALMQAFSGGIISTSDPVHRLGESRKKILEFIKPDGKKTPKLPFLSQKRPELVMTHSLPQGDMLFVLNPEPYPVTVYYPISDLFGKEAAYINRYRLNDDSDWGTEMNKKTDHFTCVLQPHESALLFVTEKPLDKKPVNMWNWQG